MPRLKTMLLPVIASSLLVQGCIALKPRAPLLHGRQLHFGGETFTTTSEEAEAGSMATATVTAKTGTPSITCDAELSLFIDLMPTEAVEMPEHTSFSSSYYEEHPRTAIYPIYECDWIAEIPEDLDEAALEVSRKTEEWLAGLSPVEDKEIYNGVMLYLDCAAENYEYMPCQVEFDNYYLGVGERAERDESPESPESPESDESDDSDESEESAGGRGMEFNGVAGIPAFGVAPIGALLLGML